MGAELEFIKVRHIPEPPQDLYVVKVAEHNIQAVAYWVGSEEVIYPILLSDGMLGQRTRPWFVLPNGEEVTVGHYLIHDNVNGFMPLSQYQFENHYTVLDS